MNQTQRTYSPVYLSRRVQALGKRVDVHIFRRLSRRLVPIDSDRTATLARIAAGLLMLLTTAVATAGPSGGDDSGVQNPATASTTATEPISQHSTEPPKRPLGVPSKSDGKRELGLKSAGDGTSTSSGLVKTTLSLGAVLVLIVLVAKVAKRFIGPRLGMATSLGPAKAPSGILEIIGRYSIGSGLSIVLLKVDRRVLVLSQSGSGKMALRGGGASLATLCEISDAEDVASILTKARDAEGDSIAAKFRELLDKYTGSDEAADASAPLARQASESENESAPTPRRATVVTTTPRMPPIRVTAANGKTNAKKEQTGVIA